MTKVYFQQTKKFQKQLKKLKKTIPSIEKDISTFQLALGIEPTGWSRIRSDMIAGLGEMIILPVYKSRKIYLSCEKKISSSLRIVYVYDASSDIVEIVEFAEIYKKNQQSNHDIKYIQERYSHIDSLKSINN